MSWPGRAVVAAVVPLLTICAATLYYYLSSRREKESELENDDTKSIVINVPKEAVGKIIGKGGSSLRSIEEKTDTAITINDIATGTVCTIVGSSYNATSAAAMIKEIIELYANQCIEEVRVPAITCGKIIGRGGENIKLMSSKAKAAIDIIKGNATLDNKRRIIIRGSTSQIEVAKTMIEEVVRSHREFKDFSFSDNDLVEPETFDPPDVTPEYEKLTAMPNETTVNVYVSAAFKPKTVYLQHANNKSALLDRLIDNMTEFYNLSENRKKYQVSQAVKGQMVAAQYDNFSDKWYRCIVKEAKGVTVEVYYADYGDTLLKNLCNICSIHSDFLKLKFQAIEAVLDNITSTGKEWSEDDQTQFLDILSVGEWKMMSAQVTHYETVDVDSTTKSLPAVKLYNLTDEPAVDVLKELVEKGLVKWKSELDGGDEEVTKVDGKVNELINGNNEPHANED